MPYAYSMSTLLNKRYIFGAPPKFHPKRKNVSITFDLCQHSPVATQQMFKSCATLHSLHVVELPAQHTEYNEPPGEGQWPAL